MTVIPLDLTGSSRVHQNGDDGQVSGKMAVQDQKPQRHTHMEKKAGEQETDVHNNLERNNREQVRRACNHRGRKADTDGVNRPETETKQYVNQNQTNCVTEKNEIDQT